MGGFGGTQWPMNRLILTLLFCISFMSLGQAGGLCEKAQINSLTMGESDNLCLKPDGSLTKVENQTLLHLIDLHEQVAKLLKVPVTSLFSNPFNVSLREYVFGPFLSSANAFSLNLGVYPGEDYKINSGVYLHELGHLLAASQNPALPAIFVDLDNSVLFSETFADLLAMSVHGDILTPEGTCLDRLRYITTFQSYNYPAEYFQSFSEARIRKCCDSLIKTTTEEKFLNLCSAAKDYFSSDVTFSSPFDPTNSKNLDDHQVGLPILSFFKSFAEKTNQSMQAVFEKIFFSTHAYSVDTFQCELKLADQTVAVYSETLHTAEHMLNDFKATLTMEHLPLYETLFKKHALEKGVMFSALGADKVIKDKLIKKINKQNNISDICGGKIDHSQKKNCYLSCSN
jgi:hypothetical protein